MLASLLSALWLVAAPAQPDKPPEKPADKSASKDKPADKPSAPSADKVPDKLTTPAPAAVAGDTPNPAELKLLQQSVLPKELKAVDASVHGLAKLPLYRIQVDIDPENRTFHGQEQIRDPVSETTGVIYLRVFNNASYLTRENNPPAVLVSGLHCPEQACTLVDQNEPSLFKVQFDPPLQSGQVARIDLEFKGIVPVLDEKQLSAQGQLQAQFGLLANRGGASSDHGAFAVGEGVLALTGMFPQLAAHTDEGWDTASPSGIGDVAGYDIANYLFTATVSAGLKVITGGIQLGEAPTPDGRTQITSASAAVRDFPVYASSRWIETSTKSGDIKVTAYTLPGDEENGKKVLDAAAKSLKLFASKFGSYPWAEFKVVEQALTDGAGGIEYPTLVGVATLLYRSEHMLGPYAAIMGGNSQQKLGSHEAQLTMSDKLLEFAVAHEVAHQWWSSLIGSDPHMHPALDEPLTQYTASLYLEEHRGKAAANEALDTQVAMSYQMMRQAGVADGPANQPTNAFDNPLQYAGLIYGKAPLFYRAARKMLGDATFNKVLARYAQRYRLGSDAPDDGIVLACKDVAPAQAKKLEQLRQRWFDEAHGDQDVGQMDMGKLLESSTGMKMSDQEKQAVQQLMPQLMQMLQGGVDASQLVPGATKQGQAGSKGQPTP
jgi:hypothetical protein